MNIRKQSFMDGSAVHARRPGRLLYGILTAACVLASGLQSKAGTVTYTFDTDPTTGTNPIEVYQTGFADSSGSSVYWQGKGGNPGGFLGLTWPLGSSSSIVIFPDIDAGKIVSTFTFETDLRIGNPQQNERAADGFSINFARASDPVFQNHASSDFATSGAVETGTQTGLAISFDTWSGNTLPDGGDIEGIIVRVDNVTILRQPMPTRNGACDDTTSLQTGPRDLPYWTDAIAAGTMPDAAFLPESWAGLCWKHLTVELDSASKLTITYKGLKILDKFQTTFFPSAGKIVLAGRTGGADEHGHFDNLKLTTTTLTDAQPPTAPTALTGTAVHARRVSLSWTAGTDDSGRIAYEVERDGAVLPSVAVGTTFVESGLKPETSYSYRVRSIDPAQNRSAFTAAFVIKTPAEAAVFTEGVLKWEGYYGISGVALDAFTSDPKYPDSPDVVKVVGGSEGPSGFADNYGMRLTGFVIPETTGNYVFFLSCDDNGGLFLSTDDKPANKKQIAAETAWSNSREWTTSGGSSDLSSKRSDEFPGTEWPTGNTITLTAGKRYYVEALGHEGGGGDNLSFTMVKAGTAPSGVLTGKVIGAVLDPNQGPPSILEAPKGATLAVGGAATFSAKAIGSPPLTYQWNFRPLTSLTGKDIAGATSATYTLPAAGGADVGFYSVTVKNDEGSASSPAAMVTLEGTLFIEAEDFNFGGGKTITDKPIGMTGPYPGGDFRDLGSDADVDIDYHNAGGNAGQPYRSTTGVAADKQNAHADGIPRGGFDVQFNNVVGWNDAGDWQNYTRTFPTPAKDYAVYGRLSSGGNAINQLVDEVTAGAKTTTQTLKHIGQYAPGRATAGWDNMEWFPLIDDAKNPVVLNLGGEKTFRLTTADGANLDIDYMMFVPVAAAPVALSDVTVPTDVIVSSHASNRSPGAEQVANAIDGKSSTKYLNFGDGTDTSAPLTGITGFTVWSSAGGSVVTGLGLTSANDAPERDPATYKLEGSNDGTTFTEISSGAVKAFTARLQRQEITFANTKEYQIYRLTFPTVANNTSANSMQIAEVEFLGKVTTPRPKLSISNVAGKITITYTGTLQGADAVNGPYTDVAGATSPRDVTPSAAMKFYRAK